MDVGCAATGTDGNSTGEFQFEVPITNLKLEASDDVDILYVVKEVTADFVALEDDTTGEDFLTTGSGAIVIDETESIEPLKTSVELNRNTIFIETDNAISTDHTMLERTSAIHTEATIDNNNLIEVTVDFDETSKDVISKTDSGTSVINKTEPLKTVVDANRNNVLIEINDAIVIDDIISGKSSAIDNIDKSSNNIDQSKNALDLDETGNINESKIQSKADIDVREIKYSIDINETQIQNVAVFDGNRTDSEKNNDRDGKETENVIDVDETVVLLDGNRPDSDVILLDENKTDSASTIILDDDDINKYNNYTEYFQGLPKQVEVIDVEKDTDCSIVESTIKLKRKCDQNNIYKDNPLLLELVEKCLDMENTEGMTRVINRTLLVIYKAADENYKKSEIFKKLLTRTIMHLDVAPERKFSHIKNLCNELKLNQAKKRVPFITLKDDDDREQSTSSVPKKRRKVDVVIDLDDDIRNDAQPNQTKGVVKTTNGIFPIGKVYPSIEIDDDSSCDVLYQNNDNDVIVLDRNKSNKEISKSKNQGNKTIRKKKRGRPRKYILSTKPKVKKKNKPPKTTYRAINQKVSTFTSQKDISNNLHRISDPEMLLEPRLATEVSLTEFNQDRVKAIETQIAHLKKRLEVLEEAEVHTNSRLSPYLMCEQIKMYILNLYKELCSITGTEVNKRHEVRLQVVPGHPEGPVRCLEQFLNDNIDEDGNPPFPDMDDVMQCVINANYKYDMRWTQKQLVGEAHALFTQFGRKMQKRRQKREWKDLLSLVKQEIQDPAEDDPELLARLEANTRLARKNEHDLLERFVNLEHGLASRPDPELRFSQSGDSGEDTDEDTPHFGGEIATNMNSTAATETTHCGDKFSTNMNSTAASETTVEPDTPSGFSNHICGAKTINYSSTVSVCGGNIVVQPTIKYGAPNTTTDDVTLYSAEFKSFIMKTYSEPPKQVVCHNRYKKNINSAQGESAELNSFAKTKEVGPPIVQNTQQISSNANKDARNLAKELLILIQSDLRSPDANYLTKDVYKTPCPVLPSLNPTVRLTNIDPNFCAKNGQSKSLTNIAPNIDESNVIKQKLATSNGFQTNVHTPEQKNMQPNLNSYTELTTQNTDSADKEVNMNNVEEKMFSTATVSDKDQEINIIKIEIDEEVVTSAPVSTIDTPLENDDGKEIVATASVSTKDTSADFDTKDNNNVDGIVKREPLDIPNMLKELGEDFTATVFDIEDPFLVIEISDSSESEDEDA